MAEAKTKPTSSSVDTFLQAIADEQQRADAYRVLELMQKITGETPRMWGDSIVGFGIYHYKYASGHEGDCFLTGFAPRKGKLSLYLTSGFDDHAALMERLGKYKTGKSCLYIRKLEDVDLPTLGKLIKAGVAEARKQIKKTPRA